MHDHCLLKVKIWVVYPTFSAESCKGPLVGVKRKRTIKERERKLKKKGRKEGRKKEKRKQHLPTETVSPSLEPKILCLPGKVLTST